MESTPALSTPRLSLRGPRATDASAIALLANDWQVVRNTGRLPHPYTLADAEHFLAAIVPRESCWAILEAGNLCGIVGLNPGPPGSRTAELGYWLGRAHWGQGIATEAAAAVVAWAPARFRRLTSGWFRDNPASGRVLEKLGFVPTGEEMRLCVARGHPVATITMALELQEVRGFAPPSGGR